MKLFIDINTGAISRSLGGEPIPALRFYANDILPLKITLVDSGVAVTSEYLTPGRILEISLHGFPLGTAPLFSNSASALVAEEIAISLDLTGTAITDHFDDRVAANSVETDLFFEVQITEPGAYRQTFHQSRATVARDLNAAPGVVVLFDSITGNFDDQPGNFDDV